MLCLPSLVAYLVVLGAALFASWETNWRAASCDITKCPGVELRKRYIL